ncbi:MAG: right-handed parallel beta-helix repeat-containing protein, partial [Bacteroidota bacterium]
KYIQWEVSMKNAGAESLFVVYAFSGTGDRPLEVKVNDSIIVGSLNFVQTGAFTVWGVQSAVIPVRAGTNTIRLTSLTASGGANLDRIELTGELGVTQYLLTTFVNGKGVIQRTPNALFYNAGTKIVLTAVPDAGSNFVSWSGGLSGSKNPDTITITAAVSVTASFKSFIHSVYYISPSGNDTTGDGSSLKPFLSVQKGIDLAYPGDTVYLRGGVYPIVSRINVNKSGTADEKFVLTSVKNERAVLDFSGMADADANQGIRLTGSYWHFYGFDVKGAGDNGLLIERSKPDGGTYDDVKDRIDEAHDNMIEYCNFYLNRDSGIQLKNLASNNSIINCDSYYNRDATDGDADGFAPKLSVGTGNYFYGCRAWQNSDDGWDGYLKAKEDGFPQDMVTTLENCWAFQNGYLSNGSVSTGNGNGFKLGGSSGKDQRHDMVLIRCLSFDNLQKGFDQNSNAGNMTLINCTGFSRALTSNSSHFTYNIDGSTLAAGKSLVHTNCISIGDGLLRKDSKWAECKMVNGIQTTSDYLTSESDYVTVDTAGVRGPRKADGSLPDVQFMKLKPGNTKLIDKGTVVAGIKYSGIAPDLGAFETGSAMSVGGEKAIVPSEMTLQNFPNPFNPSTTVSFTVAGKQEAILSVYNSLGQLLTVLYKGTVNAGTLYTVQFDGSRYSSGILFTMLECGSERKIQKMLLVK